jgi:hypothetical protein
MVTITTVIITAFCWLAMQITASGRTEYVNYAAMTAYAGWIIFFQICIFLVPLTLVIEHESVNLFWLYFVFPVSLALAWTAMLDGPTQAISYLFAIIIGLSCGLIWTAMILIMKPWKEINA